MARVTIAGVVVVGWTLCGLAAEVGRLPVDDAQVLQWKRHLVPLPKQVELRSAVTIPAERVGIVLPDGAPALARQAAVELREALGVQATPNGAEAGFTLTLQIGGKEAEPLGKLPNADQAYRIIPAQGGAGLLLVGGSERGVYYAAKTLQQFIKASTTGETPVPHQAGSHQAVPHQVRLPLATITDWPDLERRGLWGSDSSSNVRWMSDRKMNFDEQIARNGVRADGTPYVDLSGAKMRMIEDGPTYGVDPVPVILHLEQLSNSGLFEAYPETKGKGGKEGTACYSNPRFSQILAQWLLLWRQKPGVKEVDIWMTENLGGQKGCQCEQCIKEDRNVLEAKAIAAAIRAARSKDPGLGVYVLTSEQTEDSNLEVFKVLPPEAKIWYYHSLFTYNTSESPMIRQYLVDVARQGRWMGVCPNFNAAVVSNQPFTGAHFMHYRMDEFVKKGLSGVMGYATPRVCANIFNVEAAAEWSWNSKGRSPREFAVSWAVRQGLKDPDKFAEWSDTIGPVAWDIYGSEWPSGQKRKRPGRMPVLLKEGNVPELGSSIGEGAFRIPWSDIKSPEQLNRNVEQAARALAIAKEMAVEEFIHESLVVQGLMHSLKGLWELKQIVGPDGVKDKAAAKRWFKLYIDGLQQARAEIPAWERSLDRCDNRTYGSRHGDLIGEMIEEMQATAAELGCAPD